MCARAKNDVTAPHGNNDINISASVLSAAIRCFLPPPRPLQTLMPPMAYPKKRRSTVLPATELIKDPGHNAKDVHKHTDGGIVPE
ncbi:hypothetical protein AVEN_238574-1 [Araneus ventricosus]|uniref:Uncharacterized protein n=1 Tax=Araneus ventricosus TaxID=182803 RepID=A0A4Y2P741_ARAVE|nr:hypothetical protein AVEN_238574-1 [Araneus ventricosus]